MENSAIIFIFIVTVTITLQFMIISSTLLSNREQGLFDVPRGGLITSFILLLALDYLKMFLIANQKKLMILKKSQDIGMFLMALIVSVTQSFVIYHLTITYMQLSEPTPFSEDPFSVEIPQRMIGKSSTTKNSPEIYRTGVLQTEEVEIGVQDTMVVLRSSIDLASKIPDLLLPPSKSYKNLNAPKIPSRLSKMIRRSVDISSDSLSPGEPPVQSEIDAVTVISGEHERKMGHGMSFKEYKAISSSKIPSRLSNIIGNHILESQELSELPTIGDLNSDLEVADDFKPIPKTIFDSKKKKPIEKSKVFKTSALLEDTDAAQKIIQDVKETSKHSPRISIMPPVNRDSTLGPTSATDQLSRISFLGIPKRKNNIDFITRLAKDIHLSVKSKDVDFASYKRQSTNYTRDSFIEEQKHFVYRQSLDFSRRTSLGMGDSTKIERDNNKLGLGGERSSYFDIYRFDGPIEEADDHFVDDYEDLNASADQMYSNTGTNDFEQSDMFPRSSNYSLQMADPNLARLRSDNQSQYSMDEQEEFLPDIETNYENQSLNFNEDGLYENSEYDHEDHFTAYDENGFEITSDSGLFSEYDEEGNKVFYRIEYDDAQSIVPDESDEISEYDEEGNKIIYETDVQSFNNIVNESDGEYLENFDGLAKESDEISEYDEDGNKIFYETEYDDVKNNHYASHKSGVMVECDEEGNKIFYESEDENVDNNNNIVNVAEDISEYDEEGNKINYESEDENVGNKNNVFKESSDISKYDDVGNKIIYESMEDSEYDEQGNKIFYESGEGSEYDDQGNKIVYESIEGSEYDEQGNKILYESDDGSEYDDRGNKIIYESGESTEFDTSADKLACQSNGVGDGHAQIEKGGQENQVINTYSMHLPAEISIPPRSGSFSVKYQGVNNIPIESDVIKF